jgi:hypothetical protein
MKTFCEVCTAAPATLVCCADDAVMCGSCDASIHTANPVVAKHERVAFKAASAKPNCDICQVNPVYAVCHEDRAFLCRECDVSIHSANEHVAKHRRFLMSGVQVELARVGHASTSAAPAPAPAPAPTAAATEAEAAKRTEKAKGKRKASALADDAHESGDALVPSAGPSAGGQQTSFVPDDEFNSFVADFVKGGAAADAEFLDTFFDDIPSGFQEEDFGVVPVM